MDTRATGNSRHQRMAKDGQDLGGICVDLIYFFGVPNFSVWILRRMQTQDNCKDVEGLC